MHHTEKHRLFSTFAIAAALVLALGASSVLADTTTYTLGRPNSGISSYPGPYASVTVDRTTTTTADITFQGLTATGYIYLMGDGGTVGVNVNATSFSVSALIGTNSLSSRGFTGPSSIGAGGAGNEDGFGSFNYTVDSFDGFTNTSDKVTFTVANSSGTWAAATDVLKVNASGYVAAAHIFVCYDLSNTTHPCSSTDSLSNPSTGYAADNTSVPEPRSITLLAALGGLMAIVWASRKRLPLA